MSKNLRIGIALCLGVMVAAAAWKLIKQPNQASESVATERARFQQEFEVANQRCLEASGRLLKHIEAHPLVPIDDATLAKHEEEFQRWMAEGRKATNPG